MLPYNLPVSAVLAGSAVLSSLVFGLQWSRSRREGKIQLPITQDGLDSPEHDPFDVVKPEDVIEGYPVGEEEFWKKNRLWKILITILNAACVAVESVSLGWAVLFGSSEDIASYALRVSFSVYLLSLTVLLLGKKEDGSPLIIHAGSLTALASLLLFASAIVPNTPAPISTEAFDEPIPKGLWLASFVLYIVLCASVVFLPRGPALHYPPEQIYSPKIVETITNQDEDNVTGISGSSIVNYLMFSYTTKVVDLGNTAESVEIGDLPVLPANMRSTWNYRKISHTIRHYPKWKVWSWSPKPGSGFNLAYHLLVCNKAALLTEVVLAGTAGAMFYVPAIFLRSVIKYIEDDPERKQPGWGWVFAAGVFLTNAITFLLTAQLWSIATTVVNVRIKTQLNSILFKKTLTRKDVAGAAPSNNDGNKTDDNAASSSGNENEDEEKDFTTKGQIFTLFTTDADRVADFAWHLFSLIDCPIEIVVGTIFLYKLLGVSCLFGLAATCLTLPLNHWAGKVVVGAQDNLMKKRDERVALMNEVLGAIRMLKFMAWERSFEKRVLKIRDEELKYQRLNYMIEVVFNFVWATSPIVVTIVSFWHYAVVRQQPLTPSVAFTSILVFTELKFALNALPETFINLLQTVVSLKRIEKYLGSTDVSPVPPLEEQSQVVAFRSCTITWPQDRGARSGTPSLASTPRQKFSLIDLNLNFPNGELSLICGKLGSGKTLLLLALLGESDVLAGQVLSPRSPPDILAKLGQKIAPGESWVVQGVGAYVPQAAWLRNASIKDNILFNLPYDEVRYQKTLEACALLADLDIIEDGDEAEIGERGVGKPQWWTESPSIFGQSSVFQSFHMVRIPTLPLFYLTNVLHAVDAHTAHHLYHQCLKGELLEGRTVILVSHHVQLCAPGARYVVALDNGQTIFTGDSETFMKSSVMGGLIQSRDVAEDEKEEAAIERKIDNDASRILPPPSDTTSITGTVPVKEKKPPRKLISEEQRAVGRIQQEIYNLYLKAFGGYIFWFTFIFAFVLATLVPVADNGWLRYWSNNALSGNETHGATFYIGVYTAITMTGALIQTVRWFVLYHGSIAASVKLYKNLLEAVLFANIRFHDTVSRGRLLNRFGKDFEGIDSSMADNLGRTFIASLSSITTVITVSIVGGPLFIVAIIILGALYYQIGKAYGQASRDMRRLDSVTRSPLYSLYGETIAGVSILRAFGASSKFLRDMLLNVDTNVTPYYWMWGVNRWLSIRFNLLSCAVIGVTAAVCLLNKRIDSSFAGFALTFASSIIGDILFMVRRFVQMEQSMVALERVKEYSDLKPEGPEFIEPRPEASWPHAGQIQCEDLVIKYAPDLPNVLHDVSFKINPGEKVGVLGRTGSGKSTLALSLFRFVEATKGRILVDGKDIAEIGLTDLRSRLTIIPQDPSILSGTLRSTLDVFDEYDDAEIYEALRRVHLIPSSSPSPSETSQEEAVNVNLFKNLDSVVNEGGENFSTGEKQLVCMARAVLRRSKILVMDEATASVDYATDELISQTIRHEFSDSTILTIAHRLRTVIDYDRVMLLEQGRIVEFDKPSVLLQDTSSRFCALCKATGKEEFSMLKKMAGV